MSAAKLPRTFTSGPAKDMRLSSDARTHKACAHHQTLSSEQYRRNQLAQEAEDALIAESETLLLRCREFNASASTLSASCAAQESADRQPFLPSEQYRRIQSEQEALDARIATAEVARLHHRSQEIAVNADSAPDLSLKLPQKGAALTELQVTGAILPQEKLPEEDAAATREQQDTVAILPQEEFAPSASEHNVSVQQRQKDSTSTAVLPPTDGRRGARSSCLPQAPTHPIAQASRPKDKPAPPNILDQAAAEPPKGRPQPEVVAASTRRTQRVQAPPLNLSRVHSVKPAPRALVPPANLAPVKTPEPGAGHAAELVYEPSKGNSRAPTHSPTRGPKALSRSNSRYMEVDAFLESIDSMSQDGSTTGLNNNRWEIPREMFHSGRLRSLACVASSAAFAKSSMKNGEAGSCKADEGSSTSGVNASSTMDCACDPSSSSCAVERTTSGSRRGGGKRLGSPKPTESAKKKNSLRMAASTEIMASKELDRVRKLNTRTKGTTGRSVRDVPSVSANQHGQPSSMKGPTRPKGEQQCSSAVALDMASLSLDAVEGSEAPMILETSDVAAAILETSDVGAAHEVELACESEKSDACNSQLAQPIPACETNETDKLVHPGVTFSRAAVLAAAQIDSNTLSVARNLLGYRDVVQESGECASSDVAAVSSMDPEIVGRDSITSSAHAGKATLGRQALLVEPRNERETVLLERNTSSQKEGRTSVNRDSPIDADASFCSSSKRVPACAPTCAVKSHDVALSSLTATRSIGHAVAPGAVGIDAAGERSIERVRTVALPESLSSVLMPQQNQVSLDDLRDCSRAWSSETDKSSAGGAPSQSESLFLKVIPFTCCTEGKTKAQQDLVGAAPKAVPRPFTTSAVTTSLEEICEKEQSEGLRQQLVREVKAAIESTQHKLQERLDAAQFSELQARLSIDARQREQTKSLMAERALEGTLLREAREKAKEDTRRREEGEFLARLKRAEENAERGQMRTPSAFFDIFKDSTHPSTKQPAWRGDRIDPHAWSTCSKPVGAVYADTAMHGANLPVRTPSIADANPPTEPSMSSSVSAVDARRNVKERQKIAEKKMLANRKKLQAKRNEIKVTMQKRIMPRQMQSVERRHLSPEEEAEVRAAAKGALSRGESERMAMRQLDHAIMVKNKHLIEEAMHRIVELASQGPIPDRAVLLLRQARALVAVLPKEAIRLCFVNATLKSKLRTKDLIRALSNDGGTVDREKFHLVFRDICVQGITDDDIYDLFDSFDYEGTGQIITQELWKRLRTFSRKSCLPADAISASGCDDLSDASHLVSRERAAELSTFKSKTGDARFEGRVTPVSMRDTAPGVAAESKQPEEGSPNGLKEVEEWEMEEIEQNTRHIAGGGNSRLSGKLDMSSKGMCLPDDSRVASSKLQRASVSAKSELPSKPRARLIKSANKPATK